MQSTHCSPQLLDLINLVDSLEDHGFTLAPLDGVSFSKV